MEETNVHEEYFEANQEERQDTDDVVEYVSIPQPGGYEQLQIARKPTALLGANYTSPGEDAVEVDVFAAGVNYADVCIRWGLYESAKKFVGWPITPGFEFSGVVRKAASEARSDTLESGAQHPPASASKMNSNMQAKQRGKFKPGDRVFGVTMFGAYSKRVIVPAHQLFHLPESLSYEEGAAFLAVYMTAYYALNVLAQPPSGSSVLIHSAAGGVGGLLSNLARIRGNKAVGVVGRSDKIEYAERCGCDAVVDKSKCDSHAAMWTEIERHGADGLFTAVFDANGPSTLKQSYEHLAPTGRLVTYGFHSMLPRSGGRLNICHWMRVAWDFLTTPRFSPFDMTRSNKSVMGFNLSFLFSHTEILEMAMSDFFKWHDAGALNPPLVTSYALRDVATAHAAIESGKTRGKLVLLPIPVAQREAIIRYIRESSAATE
eukprot:gb/GECG01001032.1/.p1 GENE.gb/GECG01001032.1/~~gb/GECG01001032.1/.p1  ORF type:complete len:432 (+),score=48.00 gb/GECG01001032.1/:1-1296(+)